MSHACNLITILTLISITLHNDEWATHHQIDKECNFGSLSPISSTKQKTKDEGKEGLENRYWFLVFHEISVTTVWCGSGRGLEQELGTVSQPSSSKLAVIWNIKRTHHIHFDGLRQTTNSFFWVSSWVNTNCLQLSPFSCFKIVRRKQSLVLYDEFVINWIMLA